MSDVFVSIIFGVIFLAVGFWAGSDFGNFVWEQRIEKSWYICDDDRTQVCTITVTRRPINP